MRWTRAVVALAVAGALGACVADGPEEGGGGGGGMVYQADRRPDAYAAKRHMAQALVESARLNAALARDDWTEAGIALDALRGDLRLAARRGTLDQQTRAIALEGRAIAVATALTGHERATVPLAGQLVRDLVAYHDIYAWGPAQAMVERQGGGGGAPDVRIAPPPVPGTQAPPMMGDPVIP